MQTISRLWVESLGIYAGGTIIFTLGWQFEAWRTRTRTRRRTRRRKKRKWGRIVRDSLFQEGGGDNFFPALKVLRQCPVAFLVEVLLKNRTALGSENDKGLGCGFWIDQSKEAVLCMAGTDFQSQNQSQNYFTTGGLPPISLSWHQAPWDPRPQIFFSTESLR
jgi:hypothetical protein